MASLSDDLETKLLNFLFAGVPYVPPSTRYLAMFTAGTNLEANILTDELDYVPGTAVNYLRQPISFGVTTDDQIQNDIVINFATAAGSWGTITHVAIMDSSATGTGNVMVHTALTDARTIDNNDNLQFNLTTLNITIA